MAKAIRKNLEDMAPPAVPKATPGLNIPMGFFMARGRGHGEEVATRAKAAEEFKRSVGVKPWGTIQSRAAESSWARRVGAATRSGSEHWRPDSGRGVGIAWKCAQDPRGRRRARASSKRRAERGHSAGAAGPTRARRRLFRGEALPL